MILFLYKRRMYKIQMSDKVSLSETLNKVLTNPNFMREVVEHEMDIEEAISIVLKYYIASRDTNTHYSLDQIMELHAKFLEEHYETARENTVTHGFLTHSFNGYKKDRISRFGFDYEHVPEVQEDIEYGRRILNELEEILGKSQYTKAEEEESNQKHNVSGSRIFLCAPGKETAGFAMRYSPERLYKGPLDGADEEIIVGETKQQYYLRILEKKLRAKYVHTDSEMYKRGMEVGKKVIEYYCSKKPCIALVEIDKILDVTFWESNVKHKREIHMRDVVSREYRPDLSDFYEDYPAGVAGNGLYDLVTFSSNIPKDAISVFEVMNQFDFLQLRSKMLGRKIGQFVGGSETRATIDQMRTIVPNFKSVDDLEELRQQVYIRKEEVSSELEKQKGKLQELNIPCGSVQEIRNYYDNLRKEEEELFSSPFQSRDGIKPKEPLRELIERLKTSGKLDEILENDKEIKQDEAQYQSNLHGVSHTRRVAFFASLIAENEGLDYGEKKMLFEIAKNHDIGRVNDFEDTEHGARSAKQVSELGNDRVGFYIWREDYEILQFVIEQHSLSKRTNDATIKALRENRIRIDNLSAISALKFRKRI